MSVWSSPAPQKPPEQIGPFSPTSIKVAVPKSDLYPRPPVTYTHSPPVAEGENERFSIFGTARSDRHQQASIVVPRERPIYVPFTVQRNFDRDVTWTKPEAEKPPRFEISTAETVETPIEPRYSPPREDPYADPSDPSASRLRAYDDGEGFAFPVKLIPPPPPNVEDAPGFNETIRSRYSPPTLFSTPKKIVILCHDRRHAFTAAVASLGDGWSSINIKGDPPPVSSPMTLFRGTHIMALVGERLFALHLDGMFWQATFIQRPYLAISVTWLHPLDDKRLYIRDDDRHTILTIDWVVKEDFGNFPSPVTTAKMLRTKPSKDAILPIHGCPGMGIQLLSDHAWLYLWVDKAFNFLPHSRIDAIRPTWVPLPSHGKVYFFAEDRKLAPDLTSVVAKFDLRTQVLRQDCVTDEVTIGAPPAQLGAIVPMPLRDGAPSVIVLTRNMGHFAIVELDRWAKTKALSFKGEDE